MIEISPEIKIQTTLCKGAVYYFVEPSFTSTNEGHFFVVINETPQTDSSIILVCATSQIQKKKKFVESRGLPPETLVEVVVGQYKHFQVPTVFNCNDPLEKTKESLIQLLDEKKLNPFWDAIGEEIVKDIRRGIHLSPMVENRVKKIIPLF